MKFGMFLIGDNSPDLNRNLKDYVTIQHICVFGKPSLDLAEA